VRRRPAFREGDEDVHRLVGRLGVAGGEQVKHQAPGHGDAEAQVGSRGMFRDWQCSGPPRGVGAKARFTSVAGGRAEVIEVEVTEAERPARNVERNVGATGRAATGTYTLAELPGGGTRVSFELAWLQVPRAEALAAPLVRALVRRGNQRALQRLAGVLRANETAPASG